MNLSGLVKKRGRPRKNPEYSGRVPDFQSWDLKKALKETLKEIVNSKDSDGDPTYALFMDLPSRKDYPDYYQEIHNPISINLISKKINQNEYTTWKSYTEDWILLASNAKQYNEEGSQIYEDAQNILRLIKALNKNLKDNSAVMGINTGNDSGKSITAMSEVTTPKKETKTAHSSIKETKKSSGAVQASPNVRESKMTNEDTTSSPSKIGINQPRETIPGNSGMKSESTTASPMISGGVKPSEATQPSSTTSDHLKIRLPVSVLDNSTTPQKKSRKNKVLSTKKHLGASSSRGKKDPALFAKERPTNIPDQVYKSKRNNIPLTVSELFKNLESSELSPVNLANLNLVDPNSFGTSQFDDQTFQWTLLHCAAYYGRLNAVQNLLERGASPELRDDRFGSTALCWAAFGGNFEVCKHLITEAKADREVKNCCDLTPLELCPNPDSNKWKNMLTMPLNDEGMNLTHLLRSRLYQNGRLLSKLLHRLLEHKEPNSSKPLANPIMELPSVNENLEYYYRTPHPLAFSLLVARERAYRTISLLEAHMDVLFNNYLNFYPAEHELHQTVIRLKEVYQQYRTELLEGEHGESLIVLNEEVTKVPIPTLYFNGVVYGVGDFVIIDNPEWKKEIGILMITDIAHEKGEWCAIGLGFKFLSQLPEHVRHDFLPNEIFKTGIKFTVPFGSFTTKCCVLSVKAYYHNFAQNFAPSETFACEFRLGTDDTSFHVIKDWSKTIGVFPFFPVTTEPREKPMGFSRPSFSSYDPHFLSGQKLRKNRHSGMENSPVSFTSSQTRKRQKSSDLADSSTPSFAPSPANSFYINNRVIEERSPDSGLSMISNHDAAHPTSDNPTKVINPHPLTFPILNLPRAIPNPSPFPPPRPHFIPPINPVHSFDNNVNRNLDAIPLKDGFLSAGKFIESIQIIAGFDLPSRKTSKFSLDGESESHSLTFDATMLAIIPVLTTQAGHYRQNVTFKLTLNQYEVAPTRSRIFPDSTSYHFPIHSGLNVLRLQATLAMGNQVSSALIMRNYLLFVHRV